MGAAAQGHVLHGQWLCRDSPGLDTVPLQEELVAPKAAAVGHGTPCQVRPRASVAVLHLPGLAGEEPWPCWRCLRRARAQLPSRCTATGRAVILWESPARRCGTGRCGTGHCRLSRVFCPVLHLAEHPARFPNTALNCQKGEGKLFSITHRIL